MRAWLGLLLISGCARHVAPPAAHLAERVREVAAGTFDAELSRLKSLPPGELRALYGAREIEPD